jgi:hypothetical protein
MLMIHNNKDEDMQTKDRLNNYVKHLSQKFPDAWKEIRSIRDAFKDDVKWPDWCYCPLAGAYAVISKGSILKPDDAPYIGIIGALAPWRLTKGIYKFDADLFSALWDTDIEKIPVDVLYNMEEWAVYIECPIDISFAGKKLFGWFYHLECDANDNRAEMRFLLDYGDRLSPVPVHVKDTVSAGLDSMLKEAENYGLSLDDGAVLSSLSEMSQIRSMISVILYLCSEEQDIVDIQNPANKPARPTPVKVKKGLTIFPKDREVVWHVGYRIGGSIRNVNNPGTGSKKRPHIRRAHWHSYWVGKNNTPERRITLKWIPPTLVGADDAEVEMPFTVYKVQERE